MKRYAIVGTGGRHAMYRNAIVERFNNRAALVGLLDTNPGRLELAATRAGSYVERVETFDASSVEAAAFDAMVEETSPDVVIVTSMDSTHDRYICRALERGCDVITEKPLTTDADKLQRILDTCAATSRHVTVTFNYRYSSVRAQLKKLLLTGAIGEVTAVDFQWMLDTRHGADYFRRWHRNKANSGGLLVHKATHHFDLVNWWLADVPEEVSAVGERNYYRPAQAAAIGLAEPGERCTGCAESAKCPFYLDLDRYEAMVKLYRDHEGHDGYFRDRCVFSDAIDIEDTMHVRVRYSRGARLNYSLIAYAPWEGYRIAFTGTRGRIEHEVRESSSVPGDGTVQGDSLGSSLKVYPHFEAPRTIEPEAAQGGHGGGDALLLDDVFNDDGRPDPLLRAADIRSGAWSILVGIAANRSIASGMPVRPAELVQGLSVPTALSMSRN